MHVSSPGQGLSALGQVESSGAVRPAIVGVDAALRYRSQAPLIDALMSELGLSGGTLDGLASAVTSAAEIKGKK